MKALRREKITKSEMLKRLRIRITEIENQYTKERIKNVSGPDSLSYMNLVYAHSSGKVWDYDDISCTAGQIVELKNHVFHDRYVVKVRCYKLMKELGICLDFWMRIDYFSAIVKKMWRRLTGRYYYL